ncbi:MAG TPA: SusC/RagA family TonB-linked outer membrane protein, partial [Candidatus Alistipes intestinipullorum]|nr:SusC/RagA family TonB-linked outer membrane protein [Candidatus Alistipes intestinipullorum]
YTFRADGSSKFSTSNRWGYFHAGAVRWRFTEENWMKQNVKWLSDGSINISYGSTGNNGVGEYSYLPQIGFSSGSTYYDYSFNGAYPSSGAIVQTIGNSDLKWETTYTFNTRLDLGFLKNRINLVAEYYWKDTRDLLINAQLPAHLGYSTAYRNVGRVENRGFEFTLNTTNIATPKFRWTTDFNISFNRNKVLELANDQTVLPSDMKITNGAALYIAKVGEPIGMMYGALTDGLYQYEDFDQASDGSWILKGDRPSQSTTSNRAGVLPGYQRFKDLNNDLQITQDDMTIIGNPNPDFIGGFTNNFEFYNFDLQLFFTFSYGNDILNMNRYYLEEGRQVSTNLFATYADHWSEDNPDGKLPRPRSTSNTAWSSDRYVEDGSYLRLRNLNLGYTLPAKICQKLYMSNLRVYFSAQNLLTWTAYSGQDPTISTRNTARTPGYDYSAYPIPKTFIFGIQATF